MKIRTLYLSVIVFAASLACLPKAIAQIPCGPTIFPKATLVVSWPQLQYDAGHSGCNPYETVLSTSTVGDLGLKWRVASGNTLSSPVVANGVLYVSEFIESMHYGDVYAVSADTGAELWFFESPVDYTFSFSSSAVANGVLYVGCSDYNLYALDAKTGKLLWSYATGASVSTPVVSGGVVYATSDQTYSLNASTGALIWKTPAFSRWAPAVVGNTVYVSSDQVYALNASTGATVWKYPVSATSAPAVAGNAVYVTSGQVYALKAATGTLIWSYPVVSGNTPAIALGRVYVGAQDASVYALNASTGAFLWKYAAQDYRVTSPVVANGVVYATSAPQIPNYSHLDALDATTGALLWVGVLDGEESTSAAVANGVVYVSQGGFFNGALYAFSIPQSH
jgi:eukaryotic-like serine/threonine-protein kinase